MAAKVKTAKKTGSAKKSATAKKSGIPAGPANPEIGAITQFEHVNFCVPDHRLATLFFIQGLGFTRDPTRMVGVDNMWVNVGRQQFHLPIGDAVPFPGEVGVTVPDVGRTADSLARVAPRLKGTAFSVAKDKGTLITTSPWGHVLRVHAAGTVGGRYPQSIAHVTFHVPPGAAAPIAAFYERVLQSPATVAKHGKLQAATVNVGTYQHFHFVEKKNYVPVVHPNHVAVYVTHYNALYAEVAARGLLTRDHAREQFRFEGMADPATGAVAFAFEHEVRSLYHPDYLKPLTNRVPVPYLVD